MEIELTSSDVWIVQTMIHSAGSNSTAALYDLICIGDVLNHAIFAPGELQYGLYKLYKMNVIEVDDAKFKLTENGKNKFKRLLSKKNALTKENDEIKKILKAKIWIKNIELPKYNDNLDPLMFSLDYFNNECNRYINLANSIISNMRNN